MSEKLKGILDIKVYDKEGNLKQHETEENMITDASFNRLKNEFTNPEIRIIRGHQQKSPLTTSRLLQHFEGILLFDNILLENKEDYFKQLISANCIGHGDSSGTTYDSKQFGTYNSTASEITESSITKQWNFGEGKAVGTIKSVGMTNASLGALGLADDELKLIDTGKYYCYEYSETGNKYDDGGGVYIGGTNDVKNLVNPDWTTPYFDINFCGYRNGEIYGYASSVADGVRKTNIYKITLSKFYNKKNFNNNFGYYTQYNQTVRLYADSITPIASFTTEGAGSTTDDFMVRAQFKNKIYFLVSVKNNKYLYSFDINTNTASLITNKANSTFPSGHNFQWRYFIKNDLGIFVSDKTKIARFTDNLVFVNNIELPSSMRTSSSATINIMFYSVHPDGIALIKNQESSSQIIMGITDFTNYNFISKNGWADRTLFIPPEYDNLYSISYYSNQYLIDIYTSNMYISTIKNLSVPVVKGETDEMVVTYKIIKQEE